MGRRKLRLKVEKNQERRSAALVTRPRGRPPKKGTELFKNYKQRVCSTLYPKLSVNTKFLCR